MEIKNVEPEAIGDFEEQLQLKNVKYLTLCTEEDIVAWLAGAAGDTDDEINVYFGFTENFNEPVAKQMYDSFTKHQITESMIFNPASDEEEQFIETL